MRSYVQGIGRLARNFLIAAVLAVPIISTLETTDASAETFLPPTMYYDQITVWGPEGPQLCWHCAHNGNECEDPEHTAIC